jgi:hypothetical protein
MDNFNNVFLCVFTELTTTFFNLLKKFVCKAFFIYDHCIIEVDQGCMSLT